jgi:diacylglycerol kinase (ATP)
MEGPTKTMGRPIPVILNPAAHSTKAARRAGLLRTLQPAAELHYTTGPGSAAELAEQLAAEGHEIVVAAGGDGTVNEAVHGLARVNSTRPPGQAHTALGILPVGTMNVFSLELGLPGRDLEACWRLITSGNPHREVDLWLANDQYFVQLAGVGMDAEIIQETPWEMKKKLGPLSYAISALRVMTRKPPLLAVEIPGKPAMLGSVVLIGSGRHYGGPVPVFKEARNDDGLLDILIFRGFGGWEAAQFLRAILIDGYGPSLDLDYFQASEFTVTSSAPSPFELDGELALGSTPVIFRPAPFRLKVVC